MEIVWEIIALIAILGGLVAIFLASSKRKRGASFENYVVLNILGFGLCFVSSLILALTRVMDTIGLPSWILYIVVAFFFIFFNLEYKEMD
ncbi:hypothetical protein AZF37_06310 [endosymbiont 'TC1' of Trimyema compressum]|uniref:hypothetical protein n=1 Tax=endosymbiont 'TC1' of Trimyema compressum TaxID=243899 RepID=UPI0007F0A3ED|nr:hypothetical protein [endosymbiont 'TC1' of Trimyema compressum]AMP20836.1 hypothetical protein AZF37_06310 [endosymbiont 'TC1' of Trimyema compressum]